MTEQSRLNNLQDLADLLRSLDNGPEAEMGFDMLENFRHRDKSNHVCGSACCIGGWVQAMNPDTRAGSLAGAVMSLDSAVDIREAYKLCFPHVSELAWKAGPKQAARAVEILAETGRCDWERALTEVTT